MRNDEIKTNETVRLEANVMVISEWIQMHNAPIVRVLVIEYNANEQLSLGQQIQQTCFKNHVLSIFNPRVALDLMKGFGSYILKQNLLTIFLDVHFPHTSGINVLREIRAIKGWADFPVVVMTDNDDSQILNDCSKLNVTALVQKPVTVADFTKTVACFFHRPRLLPSKVLS